MSSFPIARLDGIVRTQAFRDIPANCTAEELIGHLPQGYSGLCNYSINADDDVIIAFPRSDTHAMEVIIRKTLFSPSTAPVQTTYYPFLVEVSSTSNSRIDYFGHHNYLILNQNQVFYLILVDRLNMYQQYSKDIYTGLLNTDINNLQSFANYTKPVSFNAQKKSEHSFVILSFNQHLDKINNGKFVLGQIISNSQPREKDWPNIIRDCQIHLTSEGSMSKTATVSLFTGEQPFMFRNTGYSENLRDTVPSILTIFDNKQSLAARLKTHSLGEHLKIENPSNSVFTQDYIINGDVFTRKDDCQREAFIVFHPMDPDTKRFVSGEIEIAATIAAQALEVSFSIEEIFSEVLVEAGKTYQPSFKTFTVGLNNLSSPIDLYNFKTITVLSIDATSIANSFKIRFKGICRAGNCRITSSTGLKGVTKVLTNTGKIMFKNVFDDSAIAERYPNASEYLGDSSTDNTWNEKDFLVPDIVTGMNAVKAASNTIVLARAALAVKLGYYKPSVKRGNSGYLNSLDEAEINAASQSLPEYKYVDNFGNEVNVEIGLVYINYTEITDIYADWKPQSVMFETLKMLTFQGGVSLELANHIFESYRDPDSIKAVYELFKILTDDRAVFSEVDELPIITPADLISKNPMYGPDDFVLTKKAIFPSNSRLLNAEYNPNGFYLDFSSLGGPCVRMPSAYLLNRFTGRLMSGETNYPDILIRLSKILRLVRENYKYLKGYNKVFRNMLMPDNNRQQSYALDEYLRAVKSTLYSDEEAAQMVIQHLIKPRMKGFGMKQVVDHYLPPDVVVVMSQSKFERISNEAFGDDWERLVSSQIDILARLNEHGTLDKQAVDRALNEVPRSLAVRNPVLWEMQLQVPRIWDVNLFRMYLKTVHNIDLHAYLNPRYNSDILLISPTIALEARSDCDGDALPLAIPNPIGQEILRRFVRPQPLEQELCWNEEYIDGEYETTNKLLPIGQHVYKLNKVPMAPQNGIPCYQQYLLNASVAKANIGPATLDIWTATALMQCYQAFFVANKGLYKTANVPNPVLLQPLSDLEFKQFSFAYTRLVQEKVIEAIKHAKNGSKDFEMFFLRNMALPENRKIIIAELQKPEYRMTLGDINKLLFIITWGSHSKALKGCRNFISLYNKGRIPVDESELKMWETFISENTYFGSLVSKLFEIRQKFEAFCADPEEFSDLNIQEGANSNGNVPPDDLDALMKSLGM
jgi:hypothetical protein